MIPETLVHKPDFGEAVKRWEAFWAKELLDRPPLVVTCHKDGAKPEPHPGYMAGHLGNYREVVEQFDRWASTVYYGAEAMPFLNVCFGPDVFAAFVGADLKYDQTTSWAVPFVEDWDDALPLELKGADWQRTLEFARVADELGKGRFLIGMLDMHSHMDCLASIRNPQNLCMDVIDVPDKIERAMLSARALFKPIYEGIYEAGNMKDKGTIGWTPCYSPKRFAVTQCDFICMLGPEHARKFVIPAIAEEAAYLDHTVYHYDGPQALTHLDDILAIPDIDVIQWVQGAANGPLRDWIDLLQKIQKAGKSVEVSCSPEEIPLFHKALEHDKVVYITGAKNQKEADDLVKWLKDNT